MNTEPLADLMRPDSLEDVVGQQDILGPGKVLRRIIENGEPGNMIFYGPSGTGKTTVSHIIAKRTNKRYYKLNATTCSVADIKGIVDQIDTLLTPNGILLYLDEIQYFNKKQQQTLLEFIESGKITIIASTTENPYFYVYGAILSRCNVFQFHEVDVPEIQRALERAIEKVQQAQNVTIQSEAQVLRYLSGCANGDVRKALNMLEGLLQSAPQQEGRCLLTMEMAEQLTSGSYMRYDKDGDSHYNILSALQKSIRGSDPDAALHYAARLIAAGDLPSLCRRLLVIASEDVGLAYPQAAAIVKACVDSALQLGLPEGRIPLAQAVVLLATAPKSNSSYKAMDAALADIEKGGYGDVPDFLKDSHYGGAKKLGHGLTYKYSHDYPNHYVEQPFMPQGLEQQVYYHYGENKTEQAARLYWERIKHGEHKK